MASMSISDLSQEQLERFRFLIVVGPEDECWKWAGKHVKKTGYGRLNVQARPNKTAWFYAHRFSLFLRNGYIDEDLMVLHHCGNPSCCNPHHLYQGDFLQNMADRERHGRTVHGVDHPQSKLDPEKVRHARHLYRLGPHGGIPLRHIAELMGVSIPTVRAAIFGKTWKRVET